MLFSPSTVIVDDTTQQISPEPAALKPNEPAPVVKQEGAESSFVAPPKETAKDLFDAIRAEREAKESRARQEEATQSAVKRAEQAEARLATLSRDKDEILLNTVGYLKDLGIEDPKDQLLVAEAIMFTHVPDRAPPGHRAQVVEAQMKRDKIIQARREAEQAKQAAADVEAQAARTGQEIQRRYTEDLEYAVKTAKAGDYPVSQAWFGQDHGAHARELLAAAQDLAEAAQKAGTRADLSPQNVAKLVESKYVERATRAYEARTPATQGTQAPVTQYAPQTAPQAAQIVKKEPAPNPADRLSDQARIDRAVAAAFGRP